MRIGVPKELKAGEFRCGITPHIAHDLITSGHSVLLQSKAGEGIGFSDEDFLRAGCEIVPSLKEVYEADLVVKVKEPIEEEYPFLREGLILFCFLHLAAVKELTKKLIEKKVIAIAYETIEDTQGRLPLLAPMSEIAGRLSIQMGAMALSKPWGGKGLFLGGACGVLPSKVVVLGGGTAGKEACRIAHGFGADVTVVDNHLPTLKWFDDSYRGCVKTLFSLPKDIEEAVLSADLVVASVLLRGASAPKLLKESMVAKMKEKSVIVDISIDQGGASETSRPTTHTNPTYEMHSIIHYCVTNMPGACALTSTRSLTNATFPFLKKICEKGVKEALLSDHGFLKGLNSCMGELTIEPVAKEQNFSWISTKKALELLLS